MVRTFVASCGIALAMGALPLSATAQTVAFWNFNDLSPGLATPFTQSKSGVLAAFSTVGNPPSAFAVGLSFFQTLSGNVLFSADGLSNNLGIGFSSPLDSISVGFALNTQVTSTFFTVNTFLGLAPVSTFQATGVLASSGFVEGTFSARGPTFDRVIIASLAADLAIDNLSVRTVVPEPRAVLLIAAGLGAAGALARRRRGVA
ncbi:MAG: PEP-CTERM sorting domain-containing protein [Gemmatimonadaceae bacterium]|jgi:hypothetical protein|nr:PEP-CTERM sorting domain-containing protein [Gemmatimonadaceae bacterium]